MLPSVWPLPISLAATFGISFDFSSSPYLDVSVRGVPLVNLCIQLTIHDSSSCVFPHSEICGSKLICSSPQLIAASHVLLRLPMPRHSPYALSCLNYLLIIFSIFSCSHDLSSNITWFSCLNCCDHTYFSYLVKFSPANCVLPAIFDFHLSMKSKERPDFSNLFPFTMSVMCMITISCIVIFSYSVFNER